MQEGIGARKEGKERKRRFVGAGAGAGGGGGGLVRDRRGAVTSQ